MWPSAWPASSPVPRPILPAAGIKSGQVWRVCSGQPPVEGPEVACRPCESHGAWEPGRRGPGRGRA